MGLKAKLADQAAPPPAETASAPQLVTNAEVEAKIAQFKKDNPNYVKVVQAYPRERLEGIAYLRKIEQNEAKERIRAATENKVERFLAEHPDIAQQISDKVAKLRPEVQAGARITMARSAATQLAAMQSGKVTV